MTLNYLIANLLKESLKDKKIFGSFLGMIVVFFIGIGANVLLPIVFKNITDKLYLKNFNLIITLTVIYGVIWIISQAQTHIKGFFSNWVELRLSVVATERMMQKIFSLSMPDYYQFKTGEIINLLQRIQQAIPSFIIGLFFFIVPTLIEALVVLTFLFLRYPYQYSLVLLATLVTFLGYSVYFNKYISRLTNVYIEADKEKTSKMLDLLMMYETIKYFSLTRQAGKICTKQFQRWEKDYAHSQSLSAIIRFGQIVVLGLGVTVLSVWIAHDVSRGHLSAGSFVLFIGYLLQFITPLNVIGYTLRDFKESLITLHELRTIVSKESDVSNENSEFYLSAPPVIEFRQVNFAYEQREVIKNLSFSICSKEKLVIMGKTGIGKTTIAKCLLGLYKNYTGEILINGTLAKKLATDALCQFITYCPQEVQILNGSLYDNLHFTAPQASEEEMWQAIAKAQLNTFVKERLNGSLYTAIGERGVKISGGEKQRIGLARVFLRTALVYVLDEPFSSLDKKTAEAIYQAIVEHFKETTVIIIAHQLLENMQETKKLFIQ